MPQNTFLAFLELSVLLLLSLTQLTIKQVFTYKGSHEQEKVVYNTKYKVSFPPSACCSSMVNGIAPWLVANATEFTSKAV